MKNVPAMRTRESSAVLGSPRTATSADSLLLLITIVAFSAAAPPAVLFREQRFKGCSLKICRCNKGFGLAHRISGLGHRNAYPHIFLGWIVMNHYFRNHNTSQKMGLSCSQTAFLPKSRAWIRVRLLICFIFRANQSQQIPGALARKTRSFGHRGWNTVQGLVSADLCRGLEPRGRQLKRLGARSGDFRS